MMIAISVTVITLVNASQTKPSVKHNIIEFEVAPTPTPTPTVTPKPTPIPIPKYKIPLSKDLQQYTYNLAKKSKVPYELVIALMSTESDFRANLVYRNDNGSRDYGLMQINTCHFKELKKLGYNTGNILNPKVNIKAGVFLLSRLYHITKNEHKAAMAYNFGFSGMKRVVSRGHMSSYYSRRVIGRKNQLITEHTIKL